MGPRQRPQGPLRAAPKTKAPGSAGVLLLNIIATDSKYQRQRIRSQLLQDFIDIERSTSFFELPFKKSALSVQTNSAINKKLVLNWYRRFGCKEVDTKQYPNRTLYLIYNYREMPIKMLKYQLTWRKPTEGDIDSTEVLRCRPSSKNSTGSTMQSS